MGEMEKVNVCRTCLSCTNDLADIFTVINTHDYISITLMACTSIQISENDGMPKYICSNCQNNLTSLHKFRTMCLLSESICLKYTTESLHETPVLEYIESCRKQNLDQYFTENYEWKQESVEENQLKIEPDDYFSRSNSVSRSSSPLQQQSSNSESRSSSPLHEIQQNKTRKFSRKKKFRQKQGKELRICYICGKMTLSLTEHLVTHRNIRDWKCDQCGKLFSNRVAVRKHQAVHNPQKVHVCEKCGSAFATKHTLARHIRTVHYPTKAFECSICSKRFENAYNLKVHKMKHSGEKPYKCKHCPEQFTCKIKFREHNMNLHNVKPVKLYKCEKCNLTFVYNFQLLAHQKKPEHEAGGTFQCTFCNEHFEKQRLYQKHLKLKHEFKSNEQKSEITVHCEICKKSFKQMRYLKQHEKLHNENGKKYKCSTCGKGFLCNAFLKEHERVHTGERPAKCEICNNAYISFRQLKKHVKTHNS